MGLARRLGLTRKLTRSRLRLFLAEYASDGPTLDIGCGLATYGELFPRSTTLDIAARPGFTPDLIADAHDLSQIGDGSYEVVLCTEVLEHLSEPRRAIDEMYRVLVPGGMLLLTTRFIFPLHDVPGDYFRFTKYGLRLLLADFEVLEVRGEATTVETLGVLCQRIGLQAETLGWRPLRLAWLVAAQALMRSGRLLTAEFGDIKKRCPEDSILVSGYYVAARRPVGPAE